MTCWPPRRDPALFANKNRRGRSHQRRPPCTSSAERISVRLLSPPLQQRGRVRVGASFRTVFLGCSERPHPNLPPATKGRGRIMRAAQLSTNRGRVAERPATLRSLLSVEIPAADHR